MNRGESLISLAMDDRKQIGIKVIHNSILCIDYKYLILYYRLKINLSLFYLIFFLTLTFLIDVLNLKATLAANQRIRESLFAPMASLLQYDLGIITFHT
jgi:dolichol kinase